MRKLTRWFLWLVVFIVPWEEAIDFGALGGLARLVAYGALIMAFFAIVYRARIRPLHPLHIAMLLFVGWSFLTIAWSVNSGASLARSITYARLAGTAWLVWEFAREEAEWTSLLQAYVLGSWVSIGGLVVQIGQGRLMEDEDAARFTGAGMNPNDLALILAVGIPLAYFLAVRGRAGGKRMRRLNWAFCIVAGAAILATGSRGGVIALAAGILTLIMSAPGRGFRRKIGLVLLIGGTLLGAFQLLPEGSQNRFLRTATEVQSGTMTNRVSIWSKALPVGREHPILGVGSGAFVDAVGPINGMRRVAHNSYLGVFVEGGAVGLLLFLTMMLIAFRAALRLPLQQRSFWFAAFVVLSVGAFGMSWEYRKVMWLFFALMVNAGSTILRQALVQREAATPWQLVPQPVQPLWTS